MSQAEREFLDACDAAQQRERCARRRRLRAAAAGLTVVAVVIAGAAVVTFQQRREAARTDSRDLANQSSLVLASDPGLALGVALWADDRWDTGEARTAVRQATLADRQRAVWQTHDGAVFGAPSADGREFVTGGADGRVALWDVRTGRAVGGFREHGEIYDVAVSPDGSRLASAGADGTVVVANRDGSGRRVVFDGKDLPPLTVEFSPDGRRLAVAMSDGSVRIVAVAGGTVTLTGHTASVNGVRFDPHGSHVVSASADGTARIWDLASGTSLKLPHPDAVASADYRPDGKVVATIDGHGTVRIWDAATGQQRSSFETGSEGIIMLRFARDGRSLVTADADGSVDVWDARTGAAIAALAGHRGHALSASFLGAGTTIASSGEDGTIRVWRPLATRVIATPARADSVNASGLVAGVDEAGGVLVTDFARGTTRTLGRFEQPATARFSGDGAHVVAASLDGSVRLWDPRTGAMRKLPTDATKKWSVAADTHATRVAFGDANGRVTIERPDGTHRLVLNGSRSSVFDVAFSPDGHRLVSVDEDGTARIWNADTGRLVRVLRGHEEAINAAVFSGDGRRVATAGADGTVRLWNVADGEARILAGHVGAVNSVAFSPDDRLLVSTGDDGTVRVWDASRNDPSVVLLRHSGGASGAVFTPDGRSVLSSGADGLERSTPCEVCGDFSAVLVLAAKRADRDVSPLERERFLRAAG